MIFVTKGVRARTAADTVPAGLAGLGWAGFYSSKFVSNFGDLESRIPGLSSGTEQESNVANCPINISAAAAAAGFLSFSLGGEIVSGYPDIIREKEFLCVVV